MTERDEGWTLAQLGQLLSQFGGDLGPLKAPLEELARGVGGAAGGIDTAKLLSQAAGALSWARDTVIAPHAGHGDPSAHPECPICRGMALVEQAGGSPGQGSSGSEPAIAWMPVVRTRP